MSNKIFWQAHCDTTCDQLWRDSSILVITQLKLQLEILQDSNRFAFQQFAILVLFIASD